MNPLASVGAANHTAAGPAFNGGNQKTTLEPGRQSGIPKICWEFRELWAIQEQSRVYLLIYGGFPEPSCNFNFYVQTDLRRWGRDNCYVICKMGGKKHRQPFFFLHSHRTDNCFRPLATVGSSAESTCSPSCFLGNSTHQMVLFHGTIWEVILWNRLKKKGQAQKYLAGDWTNLISITVYRGPTFIQWLQEEPVEPVAKSNSCQLGDEPKHCYRQEKPSPPFTACLSVNDILLVWYIWCYWNIYANSWGAALVFFLFQTDSRFTSLVVTPKKPVAAGRYSDWFGLRVQARINLSQMSVDIFEKQFTPFLVVKWNTNSNLS